MILSILLSLCFTSVVFLFRHKTAGCFCDVESCDGNLSTIPKSQVYSRIGKSTQIVELPTVVKIREHVSLVENKEMLLFYVLFLRFQEERN